MSALVVVRPGLLATVQDLGRWGYQAAGVPVGGAMDAWSHRLANRLVGNPPGFATIEIAIGDFEVTLAETRTAAITGAELEVAVNGERLATPAVFEVPRGARLAASRARRGARAYLAVAGGFDVPTVLGSRSTFLRGGFGGFGGRALRAGDQVPLGVRRGEPACRGPVIAPPWLPDRERTTALRILVAERPGDDRVVRRLTADAWTVSPRADRMGYRLQGADVDMGSIADALTTATTTGSIQVPPSGGPILLMADRQTTGGYPQPAVVIAADLPLAAQLAPGDALWFLPCAPHDAHSALLERERQLVAAAPS